MAAESNGSTKKRKNGLVVPFDENTMAVNTAMSTAWAGTASRERELIELVRQGLRNRDIAAELGVTEGTVKVYLHAIFDKLHVENRTELALRATDLIRR
jgi:DNA-binding NarL/FixJ family response regulator